MRQPVTLCDALTCLCYFYWCTKTTLFFFGCIRVALWHQSINTKQITTKRTVAECLHLNHDTHIVTPQYRIHKNKTGRHTDRPRHSEQTNRRTNEYAVMRTHGHKHTVELKKVPLLAAGGGAGQWVYGIGRSGRVGCSVTTTVHWTHTHTHFTCNKAGAQLWCSLFQKCRHEKRHQMCKEEPLVNVLKQQMSN